VIAYPNSCNISLFLLLVKTTADALGNQSMRLVDSKEVVGMMSSITSKEFYSSKQTSLKVDLRVSIQAFIYDGSKHIYIQREDKIYDVTRTYQNGMWMELYVSESSLKKEDIEGWNL